ncbi:YezD family protein [Actomonas aquatica]|uniref:YezD family protein n=1 Tax=Actomonas aquatica TaxID=2866162 RepID=A0ABZ1C8H0_9BACT|nr:YezD family protein [Opitutus sp. WL0086]WRQ87563.1 YezD family protein [Opitutus sp. WL0086]
MNASAHNPPETAVLPDWLLLVKEKVESLRYGVVQLTVHDGRVTQIERTEKTRIGGSGRD